MFKKLLVFVMFMLLSFVTISANSAVVYASNASIDQLENRGETENVAGITWDEINEMAQNSPNTLSPIQGLVLWMFAILAFLKLAQKMDSLLQSLGLNVTQTGGRAVGDLVMAGMALKHVGGAVSKGMGMFGFGGKGGAGGASGTGTSGGTGTSSTKGTAPPPIPTGGTATRTPSPTGGPTNTTHTPSPTGGTKTSTAHTPPPTGGTPTSTTHTPSSTTDDTKTSTTHTPSPTGGTPSSTAQTHAPLPATGDTQSSTPPTPSPTDGTPPNDSIPTGGDSDSTTSNCNVVGKAVDWIKGDGFAQGAIKAGVKGGAIGLGVYTVKAGASKIGSAVSEARLGDKGISTSTITPNPKPVDSNTTTQSNKNPEEYQESKPFDGAEDASTIPTSINNEEYQDTKPTDGIDESSMAYSSFNSEDYNETNPHDTNTDKPPISTTINGEGEQDSDGFYTTSESTSEQLSSSSDFNDEQWNDTTSTDIQSLSTPVPTTVNGEGWQGSTPIDKQSTATVDSSTKISSTQQTSIIPITSSNADGDKWQDTRPTDISKESETMSIPTTVNKEEWQDNNPSSNPSTIITGSPSGVSSTPTVKTEPISSPQPKNVDSRMVSPKVTLQQERAEVVKNPSALPQTAPTIKTVSADLSQSQQGVGVDVQNTISSQFKDSSNSSSAGSTIPQGTSINASSSTEATTVLSETETISSEISGVSSQNVSMSHESQSVSAHEGDIGQNGTIGSTSNITESTSENFESAPMTLQSPAITSDFTEQDTTSTGLSQDESANDNTMAGISTHVTVPHTPISAENTIIGETTGFDTTMTTHQTDIVNPTQPQELSETVNTGIPSITQINGDYSPITSESTPSIQANTMVQSQATNVDNTIKPAPQTSVQPMVHPSTQTIPIEKLGHGENPTTIKSEASPTTKGKQGKPSTKGQKK